MASSRQETTAPDAQTGRFSLVLLANRIRLIAIVLGVAAALIAVMGYTALDRQGDSSAALLDEIKSTTVVAEELRSHILTFQLQMTLSVLAPTNWERKDAAEQLGPERAHIEEHVAEAQNSVLAGTPEWTEFTTHKSEYFRVMDEEVAPRVARGLKPTDDTVKRFNAERDAMMAAIIKVVDTSVAHIDTLQAESQRRTVIDKILLALIALIGIAIGGTLAMRISRSVRRSMEGLRPAVLALARGDFSVPATAEGKGELKMMADAVAQAQHQLSDIVVDIRSSSKEIERAVHKVESEMSVVRQQADVAANRSGEVSSATGQVSNNVQTVAAGTEEMSASIREISGNTSQAAAVANDATQLAAAANSTVEKLGRSSMEIGDVVKAITSIAEQTNLLAPTPPSRPPGRARPARASQSSPTR